MNRRIPPPTQFLNRELGILAFQRRVLAQAADETVPLLERLRFITIVSSNLDEFFEIRVAGLKEQIKLGLPEPGPDGTAPGEVFAAVSREAHTLVAEQYQLLNHTVLPALAAQGIRFVKREEWTPAQRQWIRDYFFRELLPVLTPIGLDPAHPFPRVFNKSLNLAVELEGRDAFGRSSGTAIVQAPRALPRVIRLPHDIAGAEYAFVFLSSILHAHIGELFAGMHVLGCYQFRVTRNSDLFVDEEEIKNLRIALQGELMQRHFGDAVRLEVVEEISPPMIDFLLQQFQLDEQDRCEHDRPDPGRAAEPFALLRDRAVAEVQHHHDENEQHHDRAGVDDDLEYAGERRTEHEEHRGDRQQRHHEVEQRVHRVAAGDDHDRGRGRDRGGDVEEETHRTPGHGSRLLTLTGGASLAAAPLGLPRSRRWLA